MNFKKNFPLSSICSLKTKEIASYYCSISDLDELEEIRSFTSKNNIPFLLLGEGTNVVPTNTFQGLIIKNQLKGIELLDDFTIKVEGGENWHEFVQWTVTNRKYGLENLALIPGTVGAGPIQNIGAYGIEISDCIEEVTFVDLNENRIGTFNKEECNFGYRTSIFKTRPELFILSVTFKLNEDPKPNLSYKSLKDEIFSAGLEEGSIEPIDVFNAVMKIRNRVLPNYIEFPNVGSFFKNVYLSTEDYKKLKLPSSIHILEQDNTVKISSANLLEHYGWKGFRRETIGMSDQHSLVLVTYEEAYGEEIVKFSNEIIEDIFSKTGIALEVEPTFI